MLTITEAVKDKLRARLEARPETDLAVRLAITGRAREAFRYDFRTVFTSDRRPDDIVIDCGGFEMLIDADTAVNMPGATLDMKEDGESFTIENPNPVWTDPKGPMILEAIDSKINPAIAAHGGRVSLLDVQDDVAYIAFGGGCQGCGMANATLRMGVRKIIQETVPEIREIVDMTEHALGTNPYFRPGVVGESPMAAKGEQSG